MTEAKLRVQLLFKGLSIVTAATLLGTLATQAEVNQPVPIRGRVLAAGKALPNAEVILMAANAAVGFAFKATVMEGGMEPRAWDFWWVCVPIVVVGAPFGARFIKNRSRHFVAGILYVSIAIQFIAGLAIIPQNPKLVGYWVSVLVLSLLFFRWMSQGGLKRLNWLSSSDPEQTPSA